jgi:hemerythrin-like metal-binding protein
MGLPVDALMSTYHLGHPEIDRQHRQLFEALSTLWDGWSDDTFRLFMDTIESHFAYEDGLAQAIGGAAALHVEEHADHRRILASIHASAIAPELRPQALLSWLIGHINGSDRTLCQALAKRTSSIQRNTPVQPD